MLLFYGVTGTLESGGTPVSVEEKDVNFYDYDGTRLYSYTLAEVQNLTELPALPSHAGLICQGWNWTLADIKAEGKETDVGAMYITDDGKTRLYINIAAEGRMTVPLYFNQSVANGVEVNWGDGSSAVTFNGTGNVSTSHTYSNIGEYVITLNPLNNCILSLGQPNTNSITVLGYTNLSNIGYLNMLQKVFLGKNITTLNGIVFYRCNLSRITIPNGVIEIKSNSFRECYSLISIVIPKSVTTMGFPFGGCQKLKRVVLPNTLTSLDGRPFLWVFVIDTYNHTKKYN